MAEPSRRAVGIRDVRFGSGVVVVEPVNLYECEIGDDCFIGPFVEIQCGVVVGRGTRIQSHGFVCELVTIGQDCFISHGVMFINDLFRSGGPSGRDRAKWKATRIGDRVSIGSNATILPVNICSGTVIGAGAVVTRDITSPGVYVGNPARPLAGSAKAV
ncbi:MAG: N-acetyltransferase [Betaproteobacteria bacterium]|nr:MAG: N-acetyltransferase [Betaproteobacteria bacterium]